MFGRAAQSSHQSASQIQIPHELAWLQHPLMQLIPPNSPPRALSSRLLQKVQHLPQITHLQNIRKRLHLINYLKFQSN
jgi:hypothetical protein